MLGREPVPLGRARLAVQTCSSPGLATRILIPAPDLGSSDLNAAACVILHLDHYLPCGSHNINVHVERVLQDAWFLPVPKNLSTHIGNLAERCVFLHGVENWSDAVRLVIF